MVYNTDKIKPITEKSILERTTEYDIYSYYIGHKIQIGTKFNSPLRRDNNPSFGLFVSKKTRQLLFKDLSTGESGNCFKFVKLYENLQSYKKALEKVNRDLNLNLLTRSKQGLKVKNEYTPARTQISIKRKYFTDIDIQYWSQFNISIKTLRKYKVYPISKFWINDKLTKYRYTESEPMYAYKVFNKFKIYRPYSEDKWLSNTNRFDIQGLEQLPKKGNLLVITKSLKDVMVLNELGYTSIAANSENTLIPSNIISDLRQRFDNIILLYDNDKYGIIGMLQMKKKYSLRSEFIPITYKIKDISDFIMLKGENETSKLLKNITYDNN